MFKVEYSQQESQGEALSGQNFTTQYWYDKQAAHNPGTQENDRRIKQGKPTSTFNDAKEGEQLT